MYISFDPPPPKPPEPTLADRFQTESAGSVAYHLDTFWEYTEGTGWRELPLETLLSRLALLAEKTAPGPRGPLRAAAAALRASLAVVPEAWNTDPNVLPCANGLLELPTVPGTSTAALIPLTASQHAARSCAAAYAAPEAEAPCPTWDAFLQSTVPAETAFLQEFAGLALTFDDRFETALWLHGPPGSGKSTFIRGLEIILGQRAAHLNLAALAARQYTPAYFFGRSLLLSVEQPIDSFKYDHLINALLSGEPVPVRGGSSTATGSSIAATARVPAKWVWALTALPSIAYAGSGLFRRARLVNFPERPEKLRNPHLKAALALEAPGLLRWALAGLARLRKRGRLKLPDTVRAADNNFHLANDLIAQYILDCTERDPSSSVAANELYATYTAWCQHFGHRPQSMKALAAGLVRLGYERRRSGGHSYWHGLHIGELPWPEVLTKSQKDLIESLGFDPDLRL